MRLNITTNTKPEHKALMALLYSLGYTYHREKTYQEAHDKYHAYDNTVITGDGKALGGNYYADERYKDQEYISFRELSDFIPALIRSKGIQVGDYKADVNRNVLSFNGIDITFERIKELRDIIVARGTFAKRAPTIDITVANPVERKALIHILNSLGYNSRYHGTLEKWIEKWDQKGYNSILIYANSKYATANSEYNPLYSLGKEYHFYKDLEAIYDYLDHHYNKVVDSICGYDVEITSTDVIVGGQVIPHAKVLEIYNTMLSFQ